MANATNAYGRKPLIRRKRKKKHAVQVFFLKIVWWARTVQYAVTRSPEIRTYKQIKKLRNEAENEFLEMERTSPKNPDIPYWEGRLDAFNQLLDNGSQENKRD